MFRKLKLILAIAVAAMLPFSAQTSFAALSAAGPTDPNNGFPQWYQDSNGVALKISTNPLYSFFDPPVAGNAFSQQIGFGAEGFYYLAEATLDLDANNSALIVMGIEAAFATEDPINGDQFPFNRLRIRIDAPVAGTYTVTHPYGVDVFTVDTPGIRAVNTSIDIGGFVPDVGRALTGRVGPFLTAVNPAPPAGFLGNINILQTVTGSPFGTNFFRVQGPNGIDVSTDQFALMGEIVTPADIATPLTVNIATARETDHPSVDVIATSTTDATVTVADSANPSVALATLITDGTGKFYAHIHNAAPAAVIVTADNPANAANTATKTVVDAVQINQAEYDPNVRTLTVTALSGDDIPAATLTVTDGLATTFGTIASGGTLVVSNLVVPPASVTATSSKGGSATRFTDIIETAPPTPVTAPTAVNDSASVNVSASVTINLTDNDTAVAPATINPASVAIVSTPAAGSLLNNGNGTVTFTAPAVSGPVTFTYTVADSAAVVSNTATVTVGVVDPPPAATPRPVANNDTGSTSAGVATTINVIANDTATAPATIAPATVSIVAGSINPALSATVTANANGTVTFTPAAGTSGTVTFSYTVTDSLGVTSLAGTVTVNVAANAAPVANDDSAGASSAIATVINVIANDTDADGTISAASVAIVSQPANGTAVANANGTVTYTSAAGFTGTNTFTYTVNDNSGAVSNTATVTVTVSGENIVVTQARFTNIGARWAITGTDSVTAPGTVLTIRLNGVTGPVIGTANVQATGSWTFASRNSTVIPSAGNTLTVVSSAGGVLTGAAIQIR